MFHVKPTMLAEIKDSMDDYGTICPTILAANIPINAVIGDQQAATIGHCCFNQAEAKLLLVLVALLWLIQAKKL